MKEIIIIMMTMVLVDNIVLAKALGACSLIKLPASAGRSAAMGLAVTFAMIGATLFTWPLDRYWLVPFDLEYFRIFLFIPLIFLAGYLVTAVLKKAAHSYWESMGCTSSLISANCAVAGIAFINTDQGFTYFEAVYCALGAGLGFTGAMLIFAGMKYKIDKANNIPEAFRGIPAYIMALAILSMVFIGFSQAAAALIS
ncbi:MAG TPA: Rnf-Nqr domain containing protein [Bacillota bacterium]|nr:Rnf-Nqr domain containing protein [Bacillota bacterium]HUM55907.1 Rnf-Nqr domain containing protein [Bacillota bacterium]